MLAGRFLAGSVTRLDFLLTGSNAGANFYLTQDHAKARTPREDACLDELKSLNPYCYVEKLNKQLITDGAINEATITATDYNGDKKISVIVVTQLLPKAQMFALNAIARANNIAFIVAFTSGITASLFSDFGSNENKEFIVNDKDGIAAETSAVSRIEVMPKPSILEVLQRACSIKISVFSLCS